MSQEHMTSSGRSQVTGYFCRNAHVDILHTFDVFCGRLKNHRRTLSKVSIKLHAGQEVRVFEVPEKRL